MLNLETEQGYFRQGYQLIGGVDEAGRGPLAGPVVAACVVIGPDFRLDQAGQEIQKIGLKLVTDSKKLTARRREELFHIIKEQALAVEIGVASNETIDKINILQASFLAMRRAIKSLGLVPDYILTDGKFPIPKIAQPQTAIISGDAKVWTIAAASIIAKVSRDWMMDELDKKYPAYAFAQHKGYGTKLHLEKIAAYGPCPIHRRSFAPLKEIIEK